MILLLFALAAAAAAAPCPSGQCFTLAGCVASVDGVRCVECFERGWLSSGSCVCYPSLRPVDASCAFVNSAVVNVPSVCPEGECSIAAGCTPSLFGVRCEECLTQGYLVDRLIGGLYRVRQCVCYQPRDYDASVLCAPLFNASALAPLVSTQSIAVIAPHDDPRLGRYELVVPPNQDFGRPLRFAFECKFPSCGPPPNTFLSSSSLGQLTECNANVAVDPAVLPCLTAEGQDCGVAEVCGHHGAYNGTCSCFPHWKLESTGSAGCDGSLAFACTQCDGWWGPPAYGPDVPLMCSVPWTPDPVTGEGVECSGNGVFENGACKCFADSVHGWWTLSFVTDTFSRLIYEDGVLVRRIFNATIATCAGCLRGAGPPPSETETAPCSVNVVTPTASPTSAPTATTSVTLRFLANGDGFFDWQPTACAAGATTDGFARVTESGGVSIADLAAAWGFSPDAQVRWTNGSVVAATWLDFAEGRSNRTLEGLVAAPGWWARPCGVNDTVSVGRFVNTTAVGAFVAGCSDLLGYLCVDY